MCTDIRTSGHYAGDSLKIPAYPGPDDKFVFAFFKQVSNIIGPDDGALRMLAYGRIQDRSGNWSPVDICIVITQGINVKENSFFTRRISE